MLTRRWRLPSQVHTARGSVCVANTHLISPWIKAGKMMGEKRVHMLDALFRITMKAAGADGDLVVVGDMNWNDEMCANPPDQTSLHHTAHERGTCRVA